MFFQQNNHRLAWLLCGLAACTSNLKAQAPAAEAPSENAGGPVGKPFVYKTVDGHPLHLYISMPTEDNGGLHPAIVFFHGGGWTSGSVTQFNMQSQALAERGMVAIDVQYRLVAKAPSLESPQICVEDTKSAMRWVRSHASELHVDPNRIVGSGGSAGGYLAAAAALVPGWDDPADDLSISPKPNAMVLFFPVVEVAPANGLKRFGDDYAKYRPENYLSAKTPPTIIFGGLADKLVTPDTLREFKKMVEAAGGRCELDFYADQPHGFANKEPYRTLTLTAAEHFLESLGYLQPCRQRSRTVCPSVGNVRSRCERVVSETCRVPPLDGSPTI